jgi:tRNA pseudouridine38-40 synthase
MERRTYALALAYRGTGFAGWQRHPGEKTIQGLLEDLLASLLGERIRVHGAARTDAGVHADRQIASFSMRRSIDPATLRGLPLAEGVRILAAAAGAPAFHARASATGKRYRYRFAWGNSRNADSWFLGADAQPRWDEARAALESLRGLAALPGLASPSSRRSPAPPFTSWSLEEADRRAELTLSAPAFRKHQIRNLAGHLAAVALGLAKPESLEPLARGRRPWRGATAPPHGLTLLEVFYPAALDPFPGSGASQRNEPGGLVETPGPERFEIHAGEPEPGLAEGTRRFRANRDQPR